MDQLEDDFDFDYRLMRLVSRPVTARHIEQLLQISAVSRDAQARIASEVITSYCFPKHSTIFPADSSSMDSVLDRLQSRRAGESVYMQFIDDEIWVSLFSAPKPGEQIRNPGPLSAEEAQTLGFPH